MDKTLTKNSPPSPPVTTSRRLPPEIWEIILSHLTNPADLLCAINASQQWREILGSRKAELFPLVLQVPRLIAYLPIPTLLACRQINSAAKSTIDSSLQIHSTVHPTEYFKLNSRTGQKNHWTIFKQRSRQLEDCFYNFSSDEYCEKFVKKMGRLETKGENMSNPFIFGCVQVNLVDSSCFSPYFTQLIKMFQNFGEYVLSLKIRFGRGFATQVGILLTILESVPNLRHLEVSTAPSLYFFISWPFHFEEIYQWIQQCELPDLISLNVTRCKTFIGMGEMEYWDDWEYWQNKPKTVEGALFRRFQKQLLVTHAPCEDL